MICAECGHELDVEVEACAACGKDPLLDGRYRLLSIIGQGAFGTTWKGVRVEDEHVVCLKELLYQRLASFEPEEQFRREAAVLRQLDLPGVPAYIDDFTTTTGRAVSLFLVQELVDGETLAEEMQSKRYREAEVLDVLESLLYILADLHELSPPVVHRDIKPSNVMRRKDGSLVLIDFGSVKDVLHNTRRGGPSVAGTIGFMAPEQLQGRSEPATDLFGAGALAVALLSRRDPAELLDDDGSLDWQRHVSASPPVHRFLESLLHPTISGRPSSARAALEALDALRNAPEPELEPEPPKPAPRPVRTPAESLAAEPLLAPAPEHRSPPALLMVGVIVALLATLGTAVAVIVRKPTAGSTPLPVPQFTVPAGILELELGMTLDAAVASGADIAAGQPDAVPQRQGRVLHRNPDPSPRLAGPFWGFSTTIAGQVARCRLEFAVDETLSRISCAFDPFRTVESFDATVKTIKRQLVDRYGLPVSICSAQQPDVVLGAQSNVRCQWTGTDASLSLKGEFEDLLWTSGPGSSSEVSELMRTSVLRLSLESKAHQRLVKAYETEAEQERQRAIDTTLSERRALEAAERRRIEEAASRGL